MRYPALGVEPVCEIVTELGEGPRWDPDRGELLWLDVPQQLLHRIIPHGVPRTTVLSDWVSTIGLCASGFRYVAATALGFGFIEPTSGRVDRIVAVEEAGRARMNDGGADPAGRFLAGSASTIPEQSNGSLHSLSPDGTVVRLLGDVRLSNGIGWSAGGRIMYYIDSLRRSVDAFDYDVDSGRLGRRRTVIAFGDPTALPDGLCVDVEDCFWVALWGGSAIHRYNAAGELLRVVCAPCRNVTACIFGGREMDTLYITSAASDDDHDPLAGKLFACCPGVQGAAVARFVDRHWPP